MSTRKTHTFTHVREYLGAHRMSRKSVLTHDASVPFSTKEPLNIGHFCGKWPIKIRDPMSLRHPVARYDLSSYSALKKVSHAPLCLWLVPCQHHNARMHPWDTHYQFWIKTLFSSDMSYIYGHSRRHSNVHMILGCKQNCNPTSRVYTSVP